MEYRPRELRLGRARGLAGEEARRRRDLDVVTAFDVGLGLAGVAADQADAEGDGGDDHDECDREDDDGDDERCGNGGRRVCCGGAARRGRGEDGCHDV